MQTEARNLRYSALCATLCSLSIFMFCTVYRTGQLYIPQSAFEEHFHVGFVILLLNCMQALCRLIFPIYIQYNILFTSKNYSLNYLRKKCRLFLHSAIIWSFPPVTLCSLCISLRAGAGSSLYYGLKTDQGKSQIITFACSPVFIDVALVIFGSFYLFYIIILVSYILFIYDLSIMPFNYLFWDCTGENSVSPSETSSSQSRATASVMVWRRLK